MEFYIRTQKVALRPNKLKVNIRFEIWNTKKSLQRLGSLTVPVRQSSTSQTSENTGGQIGQQWPELSDNFTFYHRSGINNKRRILFYIKESLAVKRTEYPRQH